MRFCHVTFSVSDINESLRFYQDIIGLPLGRRFTMGNDVEIAFVGSGETEIELICNQANATLHSRSDVTLGFEVTSLDETIKFLKQKGIESGEVLKLGQQAQCIFICDPDKIKIQFIEYIKLPIM